MTSPPLVSRPRRATTAASSSLEPSPFSSRRPSQAMGAPTLSYNQNIYPEGLTVATANDGSAGPLRHPKPLTPSDLHSMLEKEQEAIVNRLSRELAQLRQQTASVASTASSTSTTFNESADAPYVASTTYPNPSTRHRSSSSISSSYIPAVQGSRNRSVSAIAPPRDASIPASRPSADLSRSNRSRGTSVASRQSESLSSSFQQPGDHFPHRTSLSQLPSNPMSRYEETAHHRGELESVRRENEVLRQRVRDLELTLKKYREGASPPVEEKTDTALAGE